MDEGEQLPPAAAVGGHGAARVPRGETPLPLPPRGPMGNVVPGVGGGQRMGGAGQEGFVTLWGPLTPPRRERRRGSPHEVSRAAPVRDGENGRAERGFTH